MNPNSMLIWYPKIKDILRTPKTVIVEIPIMKMWGYVNGENNLDKWKPQIEKAVETIGYPLFLRTDLSSVKHSWQDTCYVASRDKLWNNISRLIDENFALGMGEVEPSALIFREFLHLKTVFKAFNGMPIAREFRCFGSNGKLDCVHPYWFEDPIYFQWESKEQRDETMKKLDPDNIDALLDVKPPEPEGWREKLADISRYTSEEGKIFKAYTQVATLALGGSWSVDLCELETGEWYLTDMAVALNSFHLPHKGD